MYAMLHNNKESQKSFIISPHFQLYLTNPSFVYTSYLVKWFVMIKIMYEKYVKNDGLPNSGLAIFMLLTFTYCYVLCCNINHNKKWYIILNYRNGKSLIKDEFLIVSVIDVYCLWNCQDRYWKNNCSKTWFKFLN